MFFLLLYILYDITKIKRALIGSVKGFYRSWCRMILSDLWIMGKRKRLRECSLIFIMGKFKILRLCMDGTDGLKTAWLCGFQNVNTPGHNSTYEGSANFEVLQGF